MFNFFNELKEEFSLSNDIFNTYNIVLIGGKFIYVEGHKGILAYNSEIVSFKIKKGVIVVKGENLILNQISSSTLSVKGNIKNVEEF